MFTALLCHYPLSAVLSFTGYCLCNRALQVLFLPLFDSHKHTEDLGVGVDQRLPGTYHIDGEQMQGVGCFAEAALA